jgi:hypothetical protein
VDTVNKILASKGNPLMHHSALLQSGAAVKIIIDGREFGELCSTEGKHRLFQTTCQTRQSKAG